MGTKRGLRIAIFCAPWNITTFAILSLDMIQIQLDIISKILCMPASAMTFFPALKGHCYLGQGKNKTDSPPPPENVLQHDRDGGFFSVLLLL